MFTEEELKARLKEFADPFQAIKMASLSGSTDTYVMYEGLAVDRIKFNYLRTMDVEHEFIDLLRTARPFIFDNDAYTVKSFSQACNDSQYTGQISQVDRARLRRVAEILDSIPRVRAGFDAWLYKESTNNPNRFKEVI